MRERWGYYSISYRKYLSSHLTIKFISNCSFKSFSFLYVKVSLNDGIDHWNCCFTRPTAEHEYLLHSSWHPLHTKRAFPLSPEKNDVYIPPRRRSNCVITNEHKHNNNTLTVVDTISVSSARRYNVFIQLSHALLTHTYPSSFRITPSHSLNIIYFSQTYIHSLILPWTLC